MDDNGLPFLNFGDMLKAARKRKKLTQKKLAQLLGVHYNTISAWELGTYLPDTRGLVLELAHCLELDEQEGRQLLEASLNVTSLHWNVPYRRNPFFTGRDHILHKIHDGLQRADDSSSSHSCALSGLAGIGKTQCAIEYAYRYANTYSAVFWISAQTYKSLISCFIDFATSLNLPERREQEQYRTVTAVIQWLNKHEQWLLIFDDVEDIALVKEFLPTSRHGFLLFTSRRQSLGLTASVLDLGFMQVEEGVHFLRHRAGLLTPTASNQFTSSDEAAAREIVIAMGGLPLALDQAGSYIEASRCSLSDYLQLYQMAQLRLLDERESHADHSESVARTFTLIFAQLERVDPWAGELLIACAFMAPEAIPDAFFREGARDLGPDLEKLSADPLMFHSAIKTLRMYSLLHRNVAIHTVMMHRLVQVVLIEKLSNADQYMWSKRVLRAMCTIFPLSETTQTDYWQYCEQLLPHAMHIIALNEPWSEEVASDFTALLNGVANYFLERARYTDAQALLHKALGIGEQVLGSEHVHVADTLHELGSLFLRQGKYEKVEALYLRSLQIRERSLGHDHPQVASSLYTLALFHARQGRYGEAEQLYLRALSIREQALGPDHLQVATSLGGLAVLYGDQGRYGEAEQLYLRALSIREQALGPDHPQVATLLNNMAQDYTYQEKYEEAEPLFQRALRIWEQDLGPNHPRVAYPLNNLAELYREQGKCEEAEPLFQRALLIWEQSLGPEHYLVADALEGLAHLYREQRKYAEAEPLYLRALRIREQALGKQHSYVASSLTGLAMLYKMQEKYDEANSLYQQALHIQEKSLGLLHPDVAEIYHCQASIYQIRQQFTQALSLYQKALTILEEALGPDHSKTKATCCAYTHLLQEMVMRNEAEALLRFDYKKYS